MNLTSFFLLFFTFFVLQTSAYAGVFKCVKKNGAIYYNDKPCASGLKEKKVMLDKVPSSTVVRNKKPKAINSNKSRVDFNLENMKNPIIVTPSDQAMFLKRQQEAMLKHELGVDDGSYEMTVAEKKSMKILEQQQAKSLAKQLRKEAIKKAETKERNRLALIERKKQVRQTEKALAGHYAKKKVSEYKKYMESKERSGAMMTEEEKEWRDVDVETTTKNAQYHHDVNTVGSKAYKDQQQSIKAAGHAADRQRKFEREFNNEINQHR